MYVIKYLFFLDLYWTEVLSLTIYSLSPVEIYTEELNDCTKTTKMTT